MKYWNAEPDIKGTVDVVLSDPPFKGTVSVIVSDPSCKDGNARFNTVHLNLSLIKNLKIP